MRLARVCIATVLMAVASGYAQEYRATLLGLISDVTGARVAGAKVLVINTETEVRSATESNGEGNYLVPYLPPGRYRLRVEHAGFKTFERSPIELRVNDRTRLDVVLEVGEVSERITVTAESPLLEQGNADRGQVIGNREITNMPLNGGNPFELMNLSVGALYTGDLRYTRPFFEGCTYSMNGGRSGSNEFQIDGVSNNAAAANAALGVGYVPPVEATQQFKIQTNIYDAQYGRAGGGVVNLTVKSGTNRYHGAAYEKLRRPSLYATPFANNATGEAPPQSLMDQYGFEIDGPLTIPSLYRGKDRTFFMFALERYRDSLPIPAVNSVATAEQRNGDFSKTFTSAGRLYTIYDPLTIYPNPAFDRTRAVSLSNPQYLRLPFPNNQVPRARMDPVALHVLGDIPLPNRPGDVPTGLNNFVNGDASNDDSFQNLLSRIDHNLSDSLKIYGRWSHALRDYGVFPNYNGWTTPAGSRRRGLWSSDTAAFDATATVSPRTVLSARLGFNRYTTVYDYGYQDLTALGFPKALVGQMPMPNTYPAFTWENYAQNRQGIALIPDTSSDTWTAQGTVLKMLGTHSLKFGTELRLIHYASLDVSNGSGSFSFSRAWTSMAPSVSDPNSGNAIASFLLGYMDSGNVQIRATPYLGWRFPVAFLQHDWQVSRRLTLNMGIRWDYESPPVERHNRQNRGFDFTAKSPYQVPGLDLRGGLLFAGVNGQPRGAFNPDRNNFQPRFGLAYKLLESKPLVFRGGFGLSYLGTTDYGGVTGFSQTTSAEVTTVEFIAFRLLSNPFPNGLMQPPGAALGLATQVGGSTSFNDAQRKIPNVWQYSAGFQYELRPGLLADLSCVGSQTKQIGSSNNINSLTPAQLALGTVYLNQSVPNPFYNILPSDTSRGQQATVQRRTLLLPYPQFDTVTMNNISIGQSWYNSLQLKVEQRLKHGLNFLVSYTNSKTMEAVSFLNASDPKPSRELASYDTPQRLVISGMYELPVGPKKRWVNSGLLSKLIGGWQTSWMGVIQSGKPMSLPDYYIYGNPKLESGQTLNHWFDTSKAIWVQRPPDTLRKAKLRSPNIRRHSAPQISTVLIRDFRITERQKLQFKASAFNVSNTPIFDFPNTTPTSPLFGVVPVTQINLPRSIELGFRYVF